MAPIGLFDDEKEKGDDDDDEIDEERLRAYEKSRLRYYYAVMECDSSATADSIYKDCDGIELERTSYVLDLRFIPDSMEFKHPPRDIATEAPSNYEARLLPPTKVKLSWDEDEPQRAQTLKRKFNAVQENESSDDEESDDDDDDDDNDETEDGQSEKKLDKMVKYRALIQASEGSDGGEGEDDDKDMEVTFNTGLEDISKRIIEMKKDQKSVDDFFVEAPAGKGSKVGKSNRKEKLPEETETEKEQEASRAELELLLADDHEANHGLKGYNMKNKKDKGKKGKEVPSEDRYPKLIMKIHDLHLCFLTLYMP